MRNALSAILSVAAVCAVSAISPAWAQADARAEAAQAQMHPDQPNQEPLALGYGVDLGEVYSQPGYGYGYRAHEWTNRTCRIEPSLCAP
jgi:hypothetical protein